MDDGSIDRALMMIVQRIRDTAQPKKIILFGSAAQGKMHPNSDFDLLVVVPSGTHRRMTVQRIYRNLIGVGFAADIIVVTEDDIERFKNTVGMVIKPALEQGRVLYGA